MKKPSYWIHILVGGGLLVLGSFAYERWTEARDDDGIREIHVNTIEGLWRSVRNFLRPFRGVHKKHLSGYIAMCEFHLNLDHVTPTFISNLVTPH